MLCLIIPLPVFTTHCFLLQWIQMETQIRIHHRSARLQDYPLCSLSFETYKDKFNLIKAALGNYVAKTGVYHPSPLIKWQSSRSNNPPMEQSLQHNKVIEWLEKNHIPVVRKLPRLDPLILTSRGTNLSKFMTFIGPPPLAFRSFYDNKKHGRVLEADINQGRQSLKDLCPRYYRTLNSEKLLTPFNPIVRVGGGFKYLSLNEGENVPFVLVSKQDLIALISCCTCGKDLAEPEQTEEENGRFKTVFSIPRFCPHCGARNVLKLSSNEFRDEGKSYPDVVVDSDSDGSSENDYYITYDLDQQTVPGSSNRDSPRFHNDSPEAFNLTVYKTPRRRSSSQERVRRRKKRTRAERVVSVVLPLESNTRKEIGGKFRRKRSPRGAESSEEDIQGSSASYHSRTFHDGYLADSEGEWERKQDVNENLDNGSPFEKNYRHAELRALLQKMAQEPLGRKRLTKSAQARTARKSWSSSDSCQEIAYSDVNDYVISEEITQEKYMAKIVYSTHHSQKRRGSSPKKDYSRPKSGVRRRLYGRSMSDSDHQSINGQIEEKETCPHNQTCSDGNEKREGTCSECGTFSRNDGGVCIECKDRQMRYNVSDKNRTSELVSQTKVKGKKRKQSAKRQNVSKEVKKSLNIKKAVKNERRNGNIKSLDSQKKSASADIRPLKQEETEKLEKDVEEEFKVHVQEEENGTEGDDDDDDDDDEDDNEDETSYETESEEEEESHEEATEEESEESEMEEESEDSVDSMSPVGGSETQQLQNAQDPVKSKEENKPFRPPLLEEPWITPRPVGSPIVRGVQRVNKAFRERANLVIRMRKIVDGAMGELICEADIKARRTSNIDFMAQYRLVDKNNIEKYGRAFAVEDEDEDDIINFEEMLLALDSVPDIEKMSRKQLRYVLKVLELGPWSSISFKMFAVLSALCERVMQLDHYVQEMVEGLDFAEVEWKMDMYKNMFYFTGDRSVNYITADDLRIELKAGGLNQKQEDNLIRHILLGKPDRRISFLEYMAYIPLFITIHSNICKNALDMARDKF